MDQMRSNRRRLIDSNSWSVGLQISSLRVPGLVTAGGCEFGRSEAKREIFRKSILVALDGLIQRLRTHSVQVGKVYIQDHAALPNQQV